MRYFKGIMKNLKWVSIPTIMYCDANSYCLYFLHTKDLNKDSLRLFLDDKIRHTKGTHILKNECTNVENIA